MGISVILAYKPKPGKEGQLLEAVRDHMPVLRSQALITKRRAHAMRAKDGTVVEVFEWKSQKAIEQAHTNPVVAELWKRFDEACTFVKLAELPESQDMFAGFEPLDI